MHRLNPRIDEMVEYSRWYGVLLLVTEYRCSIYGQCVCIMYTNNSIKIIRVEIYGPGVCTAVLSQKITSKSIVAPIYTELMCTLVIPYREKTCKTKIPERFIAILTYRERGPRDYLYGYGHIFVDRTGPPSHMQKENTI